MTDETIFYIYSHSGNIISYQVDPFIRKKGHFPYFVTSIIGGMRRKGLGRLADFLEGPLYDLGQRVFQTLDLAARKALISGKNNVIMMGHSHQMTCQPLGKGIYVNSGA